jgi:hypothetical protein
MTHAARAASRAWHTRPETHQNLIHTDKDHHHGARTRPGPLSQTHAATEILLSAIPLLTPASGHGDDRDRTGDPLLAKQVLSQLSYAPKNSHLFGGPGRI